MCNPFGKNALICFDIRMLLESVNSDPCHHVSQDGNMVARQLTRLASLHTRDMLWLDSVPRCIAAL